MIKLLGFLGIALVLVLASLLVRDPGYIPPFDANRTQLVDSEAGAECAGTLFPKAGGMEGYPDYSEMQACIAASDRPTEPYLAIVQSTWCTAFVATDTWPGDVDMCMSIVEGERFWPTMKAGMTNAWNKTFVYPGSIVGPVAPARTSDRDAEERKELTDARS
jgi:hypothetical protein